MHVIKILILFYFITYFIKASEYSNFHRVTNPNKFEIEGHLVIGSSGQTVQDVLRFTNLDNPIDIMDKILDWGHLIPSAPDTIGKFNIIKII